MNENTQPRATDPDVSALRWTMIAGLAAWLIAFGLGNALPSEPYRMCFDPNVDVKPARLKSYLDSSGTLPFFPHACIDSYRVSAANSDLISDGGGGAARLAGMYPSNRAGDFSHPAEGSSVLALSESERRSRQRMGPIEGALYLLALGLSYPSTSIALLGVLAGLVGGCASRIAWAKSVDQTKSLAGHEATDTAQPRALEAGSGEVATAGDDSSAKIASYYRAESVFVSTARGFAATLAYLAGVAVLAALPNRAVDPSDYAKVASLASLLAFLAGYDFGMFLQLIPMRKN